ncbi:TrmB family transcriptional regulator [Halomarina salina]|uniref:TrmB family transcriptional regulator n=1 Tax=Halomarina salina TaxID=1872699 RepID=A0ABD5RP53_9EURY|nr:TrmB family transcriptional regulator [Halomarina salina]
MASLRDLGLSEYEARAYRALLTTGPTTAKELSQVSDVPMGRIYDVLNSIEQYNLVRSQSASRPKKYVAVEPETALDRLLQDKKRELAEKETQYEGIVDDLVGSLDTANTVEERFWTAAVGPGETQDLMVERLAAADDRILMVASTFSQGLDVNDLGERIARELERALDRGVEISLLMRPQLIDDLPQSVGQRYRNSLSPHDQFDCRTSDDVTGSFTVIDGVEACIEVPHPLHSDGTFAMIDLKDREFAGEIRDEFEPRWAGAEPLSF